MRKSKKEKQDIAWNRLSDDTKCWVYAHYRRYCEYKLSRSIFIEFKDWLFGTPYTLAETMIKEFGEQNIKHMTMEETQNKLWSELPEDIKKEYREKYHSYINDEYPEKAYQRGLIDGMLHIILSLFGEHNLKQS